MTLDVDATIKQRKDLGVFTYTGDYNKLIAHISEQSERLEFETKFPKENRIELHRMNFLIHFFKTTGIIQLDFYKYEGHISINYTLHNLGFLPVVAMMATFTYIPIAAYQICHHPDLYNAALYSSPLVLGVSSVLFLRYRNKTQLYKLLVGRILPK